MRNKTINLLHVMLYLAMLKPGDLVIPKLKKGIKTLILWSDNYENNITEVKRTSVLTVIRAQKNTMYLSITQPEWKHVCLVMDSNGRTGWTGMGWLQKITTSS